MTPLVLDGGPLAPADLVAVVRERRSVVLGDGARGRIAAARGTVDAIVAEGRSVYGVNTGFGQLSQRRIPDGDLRALQRNLVRSHAVGVGEPLPGEVVRGMLLLLAASLARGRSGIRVEVVELLLGLLAADVLPVVPSRGSVGASGDLAPLAHLALVLTGEGEATVDGARLPGGEALRRHGLEPVELREKEGLALLNGTHLMAALGVLAATDATALQDAAELASALTLDALLASASPLDDRVHAARQRPEQRRVAARLRAALAGSELLVSHADCGRVQDEYSLRCIPQVLGATAEALAYVRGALEPELAAVTDNPLVFHEQGDVVSGGNFHGQPLSLPLDMLAIAVAEIGGFSERRSYRLLTSHGDAWSLPAFLTRDPGTRSGLMILQYTAAALCAENQVLAHPAGPASLPTSAGQEDWNSMGATAAVKARQAIENGCRIVAIELICAAQGIDLRRPLRTGGPLEELHARVRAITPMVEEDRPLHADIEAVAEAIRSGAFAGLAADQGYD